MVGIEHDFKSVQFQQFGPWRNQWGYVTTIAHFDDEDIMVKTETPYETKIVKMFCNWEDCERFIDLIEQDRRF
jgi:hypothetical protein